jgi:hypothetical protein
LLAAAVAVAWALAVIIALPGTGAGTASAAQSIAPNVIAAYARITNAARPFGVAWIAVALMVSYLSAKLSTWLLSPRE